MNILSRTRSIRRRTGYTEVPNVTESYIRPGLVDAAIVVVELSGNDVTGAKDFRIDFTSEEIDNLVAARDKGKANVAAHKARQAQAEAERAEREAEKAERERKAAEGRFQSQAEALARRAAVEAFKASGAYDQALAEAKRKLAAGEVEGATVIVPPFLSV